MVARKLIADESGAETIEFVIAFPIFLVVALAIIQISLIGFQIFALDGQVSNASWNVSASEMASTTHPEATFKEAVCRDTVLKESQLTVSNMQVRTDTTSSVTDLKSSSVNSQLGITKFAHEKGTVHISCDVKYKCTGIVAIPGIDQIELTRHIDRTLVDTDRVEVR